MSNNSVMQAYVPFEEPTIDPYFANVKLLMQFEGSDGSTAIVDEKGHAITRNGSPTISTTDPLYGTSSGKFNGTADWLSIAASNDWAFAGDFTIEGTTRIGTTGTSTVIAQANWSFALNAGSTTPVWWVGAGWTGNNGTYAAGDVIKFALVRSGSTLSLYVNGLLVGTPMTGVTGTFGNNSGVLSINANSSGGGAVARTLDEIRITDGVARYTTNYTPRKTPFPTRAS